MKRALIYLLPVGMATLVALQCLALFRGPGPTPGNPPEPVQAAVPAQPDGPAPGTAEATPGTDGIRQEQAITARNLFKVLVDKPPLMPAPGPETAQVLEKTQLRLALWGTVAGDRPGTSWAVIEDQAARSQSLYKAGDTIQGASVKAILRNRVILTVNGTDQVLEAQTGPDTPKTPVATAAAAAAPAPVAIPFKGEIREPGKLLQTLKTRPYMKNGKPAGLLVYGIRPDADLNALGLKNGDILTAVNSQAILADGDLNAAAQGLSPGSDIRFSLSRRGRPLDIMFNGSTRAFISGDAKE